MTLVRRRSLLTGVVLGLIVGGVATYAISRSGHHELDARLRGTIDTAGGNPGLSQDDDAGKPLPDLRFAGFDGGTIMLSARRGRPLVINLWSSTCAPCVKEMPDIERVHQQMKDRVAFLGVDTADPSRTDAAAMAKKTGVTYDLALDENGDLAQALGVVNLPTTVLVDAGGRIVTSKAGALDEAHLSALIAKSFPE